MAHNVGVWFTVITLIILSKINKPQPQLPEKHCVCHDPGSCCSCVSCFILTLYPCVCVWRFVPSSLWFSLLPVFSFTCPFPSSPQLYLISLFMCLYIVFVLPHDFVSSICVRPCFSHDATLCFPPVSSLVSPRGMFLYFVPQSCLLCLFCIWLFTLFSCNCNSVLATSWLQMNANVASRQTDLSFGSCLQICSLYQVEVQ